MAELAMEMQRLVCKGVDGGVYPIAPQQLRRCEVGFGPRGDGAVEGYGLVRHSRLEHHYLHQQFAQ